MSIQTAGNSWQQTQSRSLYLSLFLIFLYFLVLVLNLVQGSLQVTTDADLLACATESQLGNSNSSAVIADYKKQLELTAFTIVQAVLYLLVPISIAVVGFLGYKHRNKGYLCCFCTFAIICAVLSVLGIVIGLVGYLFLSGVIEFDQSRMQQQSTAFAFPVTVKFRWCMAKRAPLFGWTWGIIGIATICTISWGILAHMARVSQQHMGASGQQQQVQMKTAQVIDQPSQQGGSAGAPVVVVAATVVSG